MDTVTLLRSAVRGLLRVCDAELESELRGLLGRDDDYRSAGKPVCDYDDRDALVDALARDARALLGALDGRELADAAGQAAALLAAVAGQDLDEGEDGVFRLARRVAKDRVISTVDPEARHGHKTAARGFDGYKGHVAIDPDSELITATTVTAGNVGDARAADELLADDLPGGASVAADEPAADEPAADGEPDDAVRRATAPVEDDSCDGERLAVYGDSAYGAGALLDALEDADADIMCKVQPPVAPGRRYAKDAFQIDLHAGMVTCPAGHVAPLRAIKNGQIASFAKACPGCPLASKCTTSADGRSIRVTAHEGALTRARARQTDPAWQADYKATRPKVERKIGHLMRRKHGGRRARMRGRSKIDADFNLLAGAVNLARLATLGLSLTPAGWAATSA
jgi:IS5 family transposase